ncbi:hypothetical protein NHX12_017656 [Muraenolepis orangiensis]|uniref:Heme-binding protein 1 n=1 Tax=Muraenolepis orangiensis TaxID=630683 RepID=A0A9Q0IWW3_9TELE|nr:hypothetical protein NHX12_017656 [Muraenolepis orangiensis]
MGAYGTATMAFSPVLMVLVLLAPGEGSVGPSTNNSFCTESKECLEYQLVCRTDEYEVRHYSPTRWVSTDAEAYFMGVGAAMAFRRLFQYITGANQEGEQMEMTTPVLVKIPEETKMWEPAIYTLNFLLPAAYQEKPPKPTNDKLYFTEMPDMEVYVRTYGGWMLSVTSRLHAHLLTKELDRVRASYNHTPLKLTNRHNEVWYIAEEEPVCTDPQEPTPVHTPPPTLTARTDTPARARFAAALRALRDSPASLPSDRTLDGPPFKSSVWPPSAPSVSSLNLPTKSPSQIPHIALFSLPLTSAQSPVELSTKSSVSPSPVPQTVSGPQNVMGTQTVNSQTNVTESHTVTGPNNVTESHTLMGPQSVNNSQAVTSLDTITGPQNESKQQAVTVSKNVSLLQTVTGPQTVGELQSDSVSWNATAQDYPEAQGGRDQELEQPDTH